MLAQSSEQVHVDRHDHGRENLRKFSRKSSAAEDKFIRADHFPLIGVSLDFFLDTDRTCQMRSILTQFKLNHSVDIVRFSFWNFERDTKFIFLELHRRFVCKKPGGSDLLTPRGQDQ